jgi:dihydrofolate reductase
MVSIIVAKARNGVIGRDASLPWHLPADLRRFRELTTGHTVVMGRKTYDSLPAAFRPLPDRRNVVLSRDAAYEPGDGALRATSLSGAVEASGGACFVIGGGEVYREAMQLADRLYVTEVDAEPEGDVSFPDISPAEWRCVDESRPLAENGLSFVFRVYERCS